MVSRRLLNQEAEIAFKGAKQRITAEEALEMSGRDSELDMVDKDIEEAAKAGKRCLFLDLDRSNRKWMPDVIECLRARGFRVEQLSNPTAVKVTW